MRRNLSSNTFVSCYRYRFYGYKLNFSPYGAFLYVSLQINGLVYIQYGQNMRSFCPPWMGRPQYLDQNNQ